MLICVCRAPFTSPTLISAKCNSLQGKAFRSLHATPFLPHARRSTSFGAAALNLALALIRRTHTPHSTAPGGTALTPNPNPNQANPCRTHLALLLPAAQPQQVRQVQQALQVYVGVRRRRQRPLHQLHLVRRLADLGRQAGQVEAGQQVQRLNNGQLLLGLGRAGKLQGKGSIKLT